MCCHNCPNGAAVFNALSVDRSLAFMPEKLHALCVTLPQRRNAAISLSLKKKLPSHVFALVKAGLPMLIVREHRTSPK